MGALDDLIKQDNAAQGQLAQLIAADNGAQKPVSDEFSAPLPTPQQSVPPPSLWQQFVQAAQDQGNRLERSTQLARDPANTTPTLGGMIYGASSHALDPMHDARVSAEPGVQRASEVLGQGLNPLNYVGGGVPGQMAAAGAQGGIRGFSDTAGQPMEDRLSQAAKQAALSAGFTGGLAAIGRGIGTTAEALGRGADEARIRSWGVGDKLAQFAEQRGAPQQPLSSDEAARLFVQEGERLVPPNTLLGLSPGQWEQRAAPVVQTTGRAVDQSLRDAQAAGAQLPPDVRGLLAGNLQQQAATQAVSGVGSGAPAGRALEAEARAVQAGPALQDPIAVRQQKTLFDNNAFGGPPGSLQRYQSDAAEAAGNELRGVLGDYAKQGGVADRFGQANDDFGVASTIQNAAAKRNYANLQARGPEDPNLGIGARAWSMLPGIGKVNDTFANVGRGAQNIGGGAADAIQAGAPLAGTAVGSWLAGKGVKLDGSQSSSVPGNQIGPRAIETLHSNPRILGPYAQQFAEAEQNGPQAVNNLVIRLDDDPQWRMGPLRAISGGM